MTQKTTHYHMIESTSTVIPELIGSIGYSSLTISTTDYNKQIKPHLEKLAGDHYKEKIEKWTPQRKAGVIVLVLKKMCRIKSDRKSSERKTYTASEVLKHKKADCDELCRLFIATTKHLKIKTENFNLIGVIQKTASGKTFGHMFIIQIGEEFYFVDPIYLLYKRLEVKGKKDVKEIVNSSDIKKFIIDETNEKIREKNKKIAEGKRKEEEIQDFDVVSILKSEAEMHEDYLSQAAEYHFGIADRIFSKEERSEKDYEGSIKEYKKGLEIYKEPRAYKDLGSMYASIHNESEAIECYKKAIDLDPSYTSAYILLHLTYESMGEIEKAEQVLKEARDRGIKLPF